jgi:hypothetical protein
LPDLSRKGVPKTLGALNVYRSGAGDKIQPFLRILRTKNMAERMGFEPMVEP